MIIIELLNYWWSILSIINSSIHLPTYPIPTLIGGRFREIFLKKKIREISYTPNRTARLTTCMFVAVNTPLAAHFATPEGEAQSWIAKIGFLPGKDFPVWSARFGFWEETAPDCRRSWSCDWDYLQLSFTVYTRISTEITFICHWVVV
jgi:hypothetical protein